MPPCPSSRTPTTTSRPGGPAKAVAAELAKRDVDLTDREAVDDAIRALNAEQLARRLIQE